MKMKNLHCRYLRSQTALKIKDGSWDTSVLQHNENLSLRYIDNYLRNEWVDTSILLKEKLVDVFIESEDELLCDVNRETLSF